MAHKSIDQYGAKKTQIATKDQLQKAEALLEPITLSLGFSFKEKTKDIEDLEKVRADLKRLHEGMNLMSDNLVNIQREKSSLQIHLEALTFNLQCPDLRKKITSYECQNASTNNLCKYGRDCHVRQLEFKTFFELE